MKKDVCEKIGIEYPILQGPMAWASDSKLAAAVSNAGGLGIMGIGFAPADVFEAEIKKVKTLTDKPYGCNLLNFLPNADELLKIIIREKVPVVELETFPAFFSTLPDYAAKLKNESIIVIGKASTVEEAIINEKAGVDLVSVKGYDGGGHIFGMTGTFALIPQVVDAVSIPVINSSGVADGRGIAASFMLGASAVEIGSRFLVSYECPVHDNYKSAILEAKEGDTVLTGASVDDAVRGLRNHLAEKILQIEKKYEKEEAAKKIQELCTGALRKAAVNGETENEGSVVVGQNVGLLKKMQSAEEIVAELVKEYTQILSNVSKRL
ncbi:MAG TPA: enoyl-[acyl-carrier-protein] reductase FabK [Firmicutes bacterium]|jgi:enoyl-[acyl-carrier protein] reductase II|nr:enoyl-[acyl-carrier-protein] reductase FabK [Bacillota bacterium]